MKSDKVRSGVIIFCLLFLATGLYARTLQKDTASIECVYEYCFLRDTSSRMSEGGRLISGDSLHIRRDTMLLQIGAGASRYYGYETFLQDSLAEAFLKLTGARMKNDRFSDAVFMIYKDRRNGQVITTDNILFSAFMITEKTPDFQWELKDEWKEFAGYRVRRAECSFRGRDYVAWFAPEIPVSDGPWKFSGLPGLIVEVYDVPCEYRYSLIGLRNVVREIGIPDENYMETDLRTYYRTLKRAIENPPLYVEATFSGPVYWKDTEGNPIDPAITKQTLKYEFQEIIK